MKEELQAATALGHQYVPPDPGLLQVVIGEGKASMAQQGPGALVLKFPGYQKAGDSLTLTFDAALKVMRQMSIATYLDDPSSPVSLDVNLQSLPDGTNYPASVSLKIPASQIEVRVKNSNSRRSRRSHRNEEFENQLEHGDRQGPRSGARLTWSVVFAPRESAPVSGDKCESTSICARRLDARPA